MEFGILERWIPTYMDWISGISEQCWVCSIAWLRAAAFVYMRHDYDFTAGCMGAFVYIGNMSY